MIISVRMSSFVCLVVSVSHDLKTSTSFDMTVADQGHFSYASQSENPERNSNPVRKTRNQPHSNTRTLEWLNLASYKIKNYLNFDQASRLSFPTFWTDRKLQSK